MLDTSNVRSPRTFVAAGSAALLSGCATTGPRRFASPAARRFRRSGRSGADHSRLRMPSPLSRGRLRRPLATAGRQGAGSQLRPWRRRDHAELGKLAAGDRTSASGHSGPVAVIGAGVMGLTTARLVQEAGLPVTIYTAELPPTRRRTSPAGSGARPAIIARRR
jgi:D-amino-acid oxidase